MTLERGEDLQTGLCQSFYFTAKRTPFPGGNGRMVRLAIERERRAGIPILSDNANGYCLPGNSAERAQFVRSMRNRAEEILKTA